MASRTTVETLPNEILISILSNLPTPSLLPLAPISKHIFTIIQGILYNRIQSAAHLHDRTLQLECVHPAAKRNSPAIKFLPLGTQEGDERDLRSIYAHFRVVEELADSSIILDESQLLHERCRSQEISLESYEEFTQLCMFSTLLRPGPRRGLFRSCCALGEGVVRVWRSWLEEHNKREGILWVDPEQHIGVKVIVSEKGFEGDSILYDIVFLELLVRCTHLLRSLEESVLQEESHEGMFCALDGEYVEEVFVQGAVFRPETLGDLWNTAMDSFA